MKRIIYFLILFSFTQNTFSQDEASVEKSIFNLQTGVLGIWANNEFRLTSEIALRTEIGLDAGVFGGDFYENNGYVFAPVITIEPRWYYNLEKRASNGKNTKYNSSNFLTTSISYHPDWFVISNYDNVKVADQISIIPKWGIRRQIAESNFNYELGVGIGYRHFFLKQYGFKKNEGEVALDLHIRIGYTF
ncbi:hypothetical protein [Flavobacterium sp.]|uniref:hypothetical protein n=1 Tax=Flavobacterium sp. TaxID=239 RepID=UPI003D6BF9B9